MSDELKYLVIEDTTSGNCMSMVFNCIIEHRKAAVGVCGVSGKKVVGAGFCSIKPEEVSTRLNVSCWGESVSLDIKSRGEEDEKVILRDMERAWGY